MATPQRLIQPRNYQDQGGRLWVVRGTLDIDSGGDLTFDGRSYNPYGQKTETVNFDTGSFRIATTSPFDDIPAIASHGGIMGSDTEPAYKRSSLSIPAIVWPDREDYDIISPVIQLPADYTYDATNTLTFHVLANLSGATDPTNFTFKVYYSDNTTETITTGNLSGTTMTEVSATATAPNLTPPQFLYVNMYPLTANTDDIELHAVWAEFTYSP